jgi:hypothetical protein
MFFFEKKNQKTFAPAQAARKCQNKRRRNLKNTMGWAFKPTIAPIRSNKP